MLIFALSASLLALLGTLTGVLGGLQAYRSLLERIESGPGVDSSLAESVRALERDQDDLSGDFKHVLLAVEEGIERVARAERRIKSTIRGAQKELAERGFEHPGLEAEAAQLQLLDGEGSGEGGVHPVPEHVEISPIEDARPSPIPGVSAGKFRQMS